MDFGEGVFSFGGWEAVEDSACGVFKRAVSIDHGDTMLRDQLIEDLDRFLPA
jgi:hypothetical protein